MIQATTPLPVLSFDGQDDCVDFGTKSQFKVPKQITLELWVYIESQRQWAGIVSKVFDTGSTESGYGLLLDGGSGIYWGLKVPSQGMQYLSSGSQSVPLKEWHHIAGTYDGQYLRVYVDGIEKAIQTLKDASIHHSPDNNLRLGMYRDNDETYAFHGKIAEVRLWDVCRTQAELQATMACRLTGIEAGLVGYWPLSEGAGTVVPDKTANANPGAIAGASWQQAQLPLQESKWPILKYLEAAGSSIAATPFAIHPQPEAPVSRIKTLRISGGWAIDKIQVQYENLDANPPTVYDSSAYGGQGGNLQNFSLAVGDYLTSVSGEWGAQAPGYPREEIISLQFQTKKGQKSQGFGGGNSQKQVESFSFTAPDGYEIVGFFGACGSHQNNLVRLGIYIHPVYQDPRSLQSAINLPNKGRIRLKSWKGDYLHRPDSPQGVTSWHTGIGNEWTVAVLGNNQIKLKSWKGDYLCRPDTPQGVDTGVEHNDVWVIEAIADNQVKLKSSKGDYLHRPDSPQGVTTWHTGIGNEWVLEFVDAVLQPDGLWNYCKAR